MAPGRGGRLEGAGGGRGGVEPGRYEPAAERGVCPPPGAEAPARGRAGGGGTGSGVEVLAFVGPSGTGKSHHASLVAYETRADLIVDDGLVVCDGRIVAGRSAKREGTRVGALRAAFFVDPAHARQASEKIRELAPSRVLVLATSVGMADRICRTLDLPLPAEYISIDQVASAEEIRLALRARRQEGKHVIPAPTFEVKKGFSGYLVDPLRFLFRPRQAPEPTRLVVEKSVVRPTYSSLGRFLISQAVVVAISARACREVEGIARVLRARVDLKPDGVVVNLDVALRRVPGLAHTMPGVQDRVAGTLEHMTALNVLGINVIARKLVLD
ncbi:MAG: hypothetical protein AB1503_09965 [Bacillota bacterium]